MYKNTIIAPLVGCLIFALMPILLCSQGNFSGGFQSNANFFLRDSLIGADNIPQYDYQLFGAEAWLDLNYSQNGYSAGVRFDLFNNSNLLDPNNSYSGQGIGRWFISKEMEKLGITVGYIYDQIGSGVIFRAFEERPLLIDNALVGARVRYRFNENLNAKVFTGRQRDLFSTTKSIVKGAAIEGFMSFGEESRMHIAPGIGFLNRTLDDETMNKVIGIVKSYIGNERIIPEYNVNLASIYNTLSYKGFTWYLEAAYKSPDIFFDPTAIQTEITGTESLGKYVKENGTLIYTSVSFGKNKLGLTLEAKRTENFNLRVDPTLQRTFGLLNFLPPMNRQNTYRLTSRYSPATQDLSELGFQGDLKYRFSKSFNILLNVSNIADLDSELLYRELYFETLYKHKRTWQLITGIQLQEYNQEIYEVKPEVPNIQSIVPFVDFLYKFNRKKSIRTEIQYMNVQEDIKADSKQDFGDWVFALVELNMAPHWSFVLSDMYNIVPGKSSPTENDGSKILLHYPRADIFYTHDSNRFGLSYVKQVEGIVCTGGICRLEPAFSGVKFSINSTF